MIKTSSKIICSIFLFFLLLLSACTQQNVILDENTIKDAVELGKQKKFEAESLMYKVEPLTCEQKKQPYCEHKYETLFLYTPFMTLAGISAIKAKEYEELTKSDISLFTRDALEITVIVNGNSDFEVENVKTILKYDDKLIKPEVFGGNAEVDDCSGISCTYYSYYKFRFNDFSSFKVKKVKFVVVRDKGEKEYEIDMSKYK